MYTSLCIETKEKINKTKLIIENKLTEIVEKEAYNKNKTIEIDNLQKEKDNLLKEVTKDIPNVEILSFSGLLVDFAREHNVQFCGLCKEFPCEWLIKKIVWRPKAVEELTELANLYYESK